MNIHEPCTNIEGETILKLKFTLQVIWPNGETDNVFLMFTKAKHTSQVWGFNYQTYAGNLILLSGKIADMPCWQHKLPHGE